MPDAVRERLIRDAGAARCEVCPKTPSLRQTGVAGLARRSPRLRLACETPNLDSLKTLTLEIVLCVLCGDGNRQIADRLGISVSTVKHHLRTLADARAVIDDRSDASRRGLCGRLAAV